MTDHITIPPEAVKAAFKSFTTDLRDTWREELEAAIRAALKAWPGMYVPEVEKRPLIPTKPTYRATTIELPAIILPLPQEETTHD